MLEELRAALQESGVETGAEELADILWLAERVGAASGPRRSTGDGRSGTGEQSPLPARQASNGSESRSGVRHYSAAPDDEDDAGTAHGEAVRVRRAKALDNSLALVKALRPLGRRTVTGVTGTELDEDRTVTASVEQRMMIPVLKPRRDRWLDLALVVDTHHSMLLWHDLVAELSHALARSGVFRDVRTWFLGGTDGTSVPHVASARGGEPRRPQEVADPTGHRLIVVVTDAVAAGWREGQVHDVLRQWATHSPVALANVLPRRLWGNTALIPEGILVRAGQPAAPNVSWNLLPPRPRERGSARGRSLRPGPRPGSGSGSGSHELSQRTAIPVVEVSPSGLRTLASLLAGGGRWRRMSCLTIGRTRTGATPGPAPSGNITDGTEALRRFQESASPLAQELAGYLSAVPLTLPVMALVRRVMLPHSEHGHLAEVALGGLLAPWQSAGEQPVQDMARFTFDFLPGVREALLGSQLRHEVTAVQDLVRREVAQYIENRAGTSDGDFPAVRTGGAVAEGRAANSRRPGRAAAGRGRSVAEDALPFADSGEAARRLPRLLEAGAAELERGVYQAILPSTGLSPFRVPPYVRRDFDGPLRHAVHRAVSGERACVVLVGHALSGKSRSAWEAIRVLPSGWRVWAPATEQEALEGMSEVGPCTVLWLDDLERFPSAARLLEGGAEPGLVLATVRSARWALDELNDRVREGMTLIHVPRAFSAAERERARSAWAEGGGSLAVEVPDGRVLERLVLRPVFLEAYESMPRTTRAVIDAAVDATRLGHRSPLPPRLLLHAARGYAGDGDRDEDVPPEALESATAALRGGTSLLVRHQRRSGEAYTVDAFALQLLAEDRRETFPESLWQALEQHASRLDLAAVVQSVRELGRTQVAARLALRLAPDPDLMAVTLWAEQRKVCSGVLIAPDLIVAPALPLGEVLGPLQVLPRLPGRGTPYSAEALVARPDGNLALVRVTDSRWGTEFRGDRSTGHIAELGQVKLRQGRRFTVIADTGDSRTGGGHSTYIDTRVGGQHRLEVQGRMDGTVDDVLGSPVMDEDGNVAGLVTDVADGGLVVATAEEIESVWAAFRATRIEQPDPVPTRVEPEPIRRGNRAGGSAAWGQTSSYMEKVPLLARLEARDRTELLELGRQQNYPARAILLRQQEPATHVICLVKGWTKVTASAPNGYEALLALRGPGDVVGDESAILEHPQSATVTALDPVTAVVVSGESFRTFMANRPEVAREVLKLVTERMRAADRRRLEFAALSVRERFAVLLLDLVRTHGVRTAEGIELAVPLSKQELAGSVGASREVIHRLLKELRDRGIVITGRRALVIERPDLLRRIAGDAMDT